MPIKIECQNCGFKNDLGRVFCVQCGKRLELTNTALGDLASRREIEWGPVVRGVVTVLVVAAVAAVVALAFWRQPPPAVQSDPAGVKQLTVKMTALKNALRAKQGMPLAVTEGELNGFLETRAKTRKVERITIDLKPGSFDMAAWHSWAPATNVAALTNLVFPVSCQISGRFQGNQLTVTGGRFGHIPLPGPLASVTAPWFKNWLDDVVAQTGMVSALKSVTIDDTKAELVFGP